MKVTTDVLQLIYRLDRLRTFKKEVDDVLEHTEKLQALPGFYRQLKATISKIPSHEAATFAQLPPEAQQSAPNHSLLKAFVETVEHAGDSSNPPDAHWIPVTEAIIDKKEQYKDLLKEFQAMDVRVQQQVGEIKRVDKVIELHAQMVEMGNQLENMDKQLKNYQDLLGLLIAAEEASREVFEDFKKLSSLAEGVKEALENAD